MDAAAASAASPPPARQPAERAELLPACKNCGRFSAAPYLHSFSAALDQTKNQTYQNNNGWIVTPTSCDATTAGVAGAAFCSGDCLYSYLFAHDFMTNKTADVALLEGRSPEWPAALGASFSLGVAGCRDSAGAMFSWMVAFLPVAGVAL